MTTTTDHDRDATSPGALPPELAAVLREAERAAAVRELAELRAAVDAQRATIAPLIAGRARWEQARATCLEALLEVWRSQLPGGVRIGSVVLLGVVLSGCLGGLAVVGVEIDVDALADAAAHWWTGQPHRIECAPDLPGGPPAG